MVLGDLPIVVGGGSVAAGGMPGGGGDMPGGGDDAIASPGTLADLQKFGDPWVSLPLQIATPPAESSLKPDQLLGIEQFMGEKTLKPVDQLTEVHILYIFCQTLHILPNLGLALTSSGIRFSLMPPGGTRWAPCVSSHPCLSLAQTVVRI